MELFEGAMKMFTPLYGAQDNDEKSEAPEQDLNALHEQLEAMQNQLNAMKGKKGKKAK